MWCLVYFRELWLPPVQLTHNPLAESSILSTPTNLKVASILYSKRIGAFLSNFSLGLGAVWFVDIHLK